jgi:N-acetylmuramoyl-L-alanine amidase
MDSDHSPQPRSRKRPDGFAEPAQNRPTSARRQKRWAVALAAACCALLLAIGLGLTLRANTAEAQASRQTTGAPVASTTSRTPRLTAAGAEGDMASTTVRLRLDGEVDYQLFGLTEPSARLVIDLSRVDFSLRGNGSQDGEGLVRGLRWAQKSERQSRVVLDLTGPVRVVSHRIVEGLGTRTLEIELAPATLAQFQRSAPVIVRRAPTGQSISPVSPLANERITIVIDPGHGAR